MSRRDVHFANASHHLARKLTEMGVFFEATGSGQLTMNRFLYDFACHILNNAPEYATTGIATNHSTAEEEIAWISDMGEWSEKDRE